MAQQQLSVQQIIQYFAGIALQHDQIETYYFGPKWDVSVSVPSVYPIMIVIPQPSTVRKDSLVLKFKIQILDQINKDASNRDNVLSDSFQTCLDIKAFIYKDFFYDIFPSDESNIEPYYENYNDELGGWSMDIELQLDWLADVCTIPGLFPNGVTFQGTGSFFNVNLAAYLPLVGGVLTGGLTGTTADFISGLTATSIQIPTGAVNGYVLVSDASGNGTWQPVSGFTGNDITGVTYNPNTGVETFYNSTGGTLSVSGFMTTDIYWTSGSTGSFAIKANNNSGLDATGNFAVAEGSATLASGFGSHAEGQSTTATGSTSHAEGTQTHAFGDYSHAEGRRTQALGTQSHTEGFNTTASGNESHAEGNITTAIGLASHSEGNSTTASGQSSHSEGSFTLAVGTSSHAEGTSSQANGIASHTEGNGTTAIGDQSHAGGISSIASGTTSFVHGNNSIALGTNTIVLGANITGNNANTTYVDRFNIKTLPAGTLLNNLGIDALGNVIVGSTGTTTTDTFVTGGTPNNSAKTYTFTNNTGGTFTVIGLTDLNVTGGTYSNGTAIFTNNTGGTFNVTGFFTGATDIHITAFTYNNNAFIITDNTGTSYQAIINTMTGLTVNGSISATTYLGLPIDVRVTGGTYNSSTGIVTFTNNTGGTFTTSGFFTGSTDIHVTGFTYLNNNFQIQDNTGSVFNASINSVTGLTVNGTLLATTISATTYQNLPTDIRVTGGTYNANTGIETFTNNTGGTFTVSGFYTNTNDIFVTGGTPNNSAKTYTFTNNTGGTFNVTGLIDISITGGSYNASTGILTLTNNTGGTFTASGFYTNANDIFVTGGTANNSSKLYTFTNNTGGTFNVTALTDLNVTGGTYSNGTATFTNNTGGTFNVSGFFTGATTDIHVTGFTYANNNFQIQDNVGSTFNALFNTLTGLTVNGNILTTSLSATSITATTGTFTSGATNGYYFVSNSGGTGIWTAGPTIPNVVELPAVISILSTPPTATTIGDRYLILSASTGSTAWSAHTNNIAQALDTTGGTWTFTTASTNNTVFVTNTLTTYLFNGTSWSAYNGVAILQNGNTLGAPINIGSNDGNNLTFKTSGQTVGTFISNTNINSFTLRSTSPAANRNGMAKLVLQQSVATGTNSLILQKNDFISGNYAGNIPNSGLGLIGSDGGLVMSGNGGVYIVTPAVGANMAMFMNGYGIRFDSTSNISTSPLASIHLANTSFSQQNPGFGWGFNKGCQLRIDGATGFNIFTGTTAGASINSFGITTLSNNGSVGTTSDSATVVIEGAPIASGSGTITRPWALFSMQGNNGFVGNTIFGISGITPTANIHIVGSTTGQTSLRISSGLTVTTPNQGDCWNDGTKLNFTNNGLQAQELPQIQQSRVSGFTATTNTVLAPITSLSATLVAGKTYSFIATLHITADVVGGSKFAMSGTATASNILYQVSMVDNSSNLNTITSRQTAIGGSVGQAGTTSGYCVIEGLITVNAGGTLQPWFSQNASSGNSQIIFGSTFQTQQIQ